jgi:plastocyanin
MRTGHQLVVGAAAFAFVSLAACGGGSSGYPTGSGGQSPPPGGQQPPGSTSSAISVENNRFDPSSTTVNVGTTVTWTWGNTCSDDGYGGRTCIDHNVTFDAGGGSGTQSSGTYTRQFNTSGTFNYRCSVHGTAMTGQVVVR